MSLRERTLGNWCDASAGICAAVKDCNECNAPNKDRAFEVLREYLYSKPNIAMCRTFGCG